jgi:hypothetical protein
MQESSVSLYYRGKGPYKDPSSLDQGKRGHSKQIKEKLTKNTYRDDPDTTLMLSLGLAIDLNLNPCAHEPWQRSRVLLQVSNYILWPSQSRGGTN